MRLQITIILISVLFLLNCSGRFDKVNEDQFIGVWEVKGRKMFEGIQIKITKEDGAFIGKIIKLNNHKLVRLFADSSDIWVSEIKRSSNFEFKLTEKKIAKDLFSIYGISTSQEFKAQFIDDNTIGLAAESSDPTKSNILYQRVNNTLSDQQ